MIPEYEKVGNTLNEIMTELVKKLKLHAEEKKKKGRKKKPGKNKTRKKVKKKKKKSSNPRGFKCKKCGKVCKTKAGLASHMRVHKRKR